LAFGRPRVQFLVGRTTILTENFCGLSLFFQDVTVEYSNNATILYSNETGRGSVWGYEMLRFSHCLDNADRRANLTILAKKLGSENTLWKKNKKSRVFI
jgi:hypothetical protein